MNPKIIGAITEGYKMRIKMQDEQLWQMGLYVESAVSVAIDHCFGGKKAKSEYLKQPLLSEFGMTEEEKYDLELKKALLAEEQWIQNDIRRGLPQTKIV